MSSHHDDRGRGRDEERNFPLLFSIHREEDAEDDGNDVSDAGEVDGNAPQERGLVIPHLTLVMPDEIAEEEAAGVSQVAAEIDSSAIDHPVAPDEAFAAEAVVVEADAADADAAEIVTAEAPERFEAEAPDVKALIADAISDESIIEEAAMGALSAEALPNEISRQAECADAVCTTPDEQAVLDHADAASESAETAMSVVEWAAGDRNAWRCVRPEDAPPESAVEAIEFDAPPSEGAWTETNLEVAASVSDEFTAATEPDMPSGAAAAIEAQPAVAMAAADATFVASVEDEQVAEMAEEPVEEPIAEVAPKWTPAAIEELTVASIEPIATEETAETAGEPGESFAAVAAEADTHVQLTFGDAPKSESRTRPEAPSRIGAGRLIPGRLTWTPGNPLAWMAAGPVHGFQWRVMWFTAAATAACGVLAIMILRSVLA